MAESAAPPIPTSCAHRPLTRDGLVVPWGNVELADGGVDFRSHHNARWEAAWRQGLCQVDGLRLDLLVVFLCGPRQLGQLLFDEPPVHPQCARYVAQACPMVAGERSHYRADRPVSHRRRGKTCPTPGCDCGGWIPAPGLRAAPGGDRAHPWFAVTARTWHLAAVPDATKPRGVRLTGGACTPDDVVRVHQVSEPGVPLSAWQPVPDWRDRYTPPARGEPGAQNEADAPGPGPEASASDNGGVACPIPRSPQ